MKRPIGATILALGLGWLAIAGFGAAYVFSPHAPMYLTINSALYGLAATASAITLWKMHRWSVAAFRFWIATCVVGMALFYIWQSEGIPLPWAISMWVFILVVLGLLLLVGRVVKTWTNQGT